MLCWLEVDATSYDLEQYSDYGLGQLAPEDGAFVPWQAVKKYPYAYIGTGNRQRVSSSFFVQAPAILSIFCTSHLAGLELAPSLTIILLLPALYASSI